MIFHETKCVKGKLLFFNLNLLAVLNIYGERQYRCDSIPQSSYVAKLIYFNI